ncbi:hypothetical protein [Novosphingobium sp. M1R2S20]|uniref:VanZ like protein n=1 Tax=Novosphingobium rhizovicinum TaxID=3228928 RepID=A0ABV3RAV9_9SPHN
MDPITSYRDLTEGIKALSGMSPQMLHLHAGMAIYIISQFLLGSRRASWVALLIVLEIELFNETMNYLFYGSWRWADTLSDIATTLFWPTMCVVVGKYRRWRWARQHALLKAMMVREPNAPANA